MEERKFTAASYARTDEADGQRSWDDIDRQRGICKSSAARLGIHLVASFFDIGERGDRTNRPGVVQLMAHAATRPMDFVVISSIDRLADRSEQLAYLLHRLRCLGVKALIADHDAVIELVLPSDLEVRRGDDDEQS
ncbi:recombinase family protein [Mycobacteroides abscessus]|uniref:recombinase family protein n=1 Tax=Mycobacteroides abscessus TaxID=36809 RepID=UPI002103AF21|nr:recombinase family protein [Mycobacteroides abscessus]